MLNNYYIEIINVFFYLNQYSLQNYSDNTVGLQNVVTKMTNLKNMSSDKINVDNTERLKKEIHEKNAENLLVDNLDYNFTLDF